MAFAGTHRNVDFVVHHENGVWKYTIDKQSFGQYSQRDHAISAAIQHIDRMLFVSSASKRR